MQVGHRTGQCCNGRAIDKGRTGRVRASVKVGHRTGKCYEGRAIGKGRPGRIRSGVQVGHRAGKCCRTGQGSVVKVGSGLVCR